jgi:UDP-glucose 4-epimerase
LCPTCERRPLTGGAQAWDYLYIEDTAEALCQAAVNDGAHGVYNLGAGEAYPIRSLVERIRDLIDPALPLGFGELPYLPDQSMHLQADIHRFQNATGWSPEVSLEAGLKSTIAWYRANRAL